MTPQLPLAPWLSNARIGLRAPLVDDVAEAGRWFISERDTEDVERELRRRESIPWGGNPVITLVAVDRETGDIAGGLMVTRSANRTSGLEVRVPGDSARRREVLADVLGLVVPWLLDEVGLMTVVLQTPEDDEVMVAAAKGAGMMEAMRRREHVLRDGGRVDLLQLERVNPGWGRYAG